MNEELKGLTLKEIQNFVFEWGLGKEYHKSNFKIIISTDNKQLIIIENAR